jgi:excinuclease ABC subunit A
VIRCADWVIDLGPEAGDKGGTLVFAGIPADLKKCPESYTGQYL